MKLNNRKVIMRAKEGKPNPEKAIDVFRSVYYLVLISIALYVLYYFVAKEFIIKGEGFVQFDILNIETPYTGVVKDLNITKHIQKGQFLCNIQERIQNSATSSKTILNTTQLNNLLFKIHTLEVKYKTKKDELKLLKKEYEKIATYNSMGLYNPANMVVKNLKLQIMQVKLDMKVLEVQLQDYKKAYKNIPSSINIVGNPLFRYINHPIYSPIKGDFISGIEENNTPVKATSLLFKIQTYKNLKIIGYFAQKYINEMHIGDDVTIMIADESFDGKISHISTSFTDLNFKTSQKLQVTIIPNDTNITIWKKYNLLRVKLRKFKW